MNNTTASTTNMKPLSLPEILEAKRLMEALPKAQWTLIAPDGRVWIQDNPTDLLPVLLPHHPLLKGVL